ncbi:hypothetical protein [Candidatus Nitrotoga sp. HW29]|uniref:hypothetical protein n=1 Tax=Candidatus Nitrotoga sp. HW29 TaxID=2886963 RepID=UPI001EF32F07|nr:hypothetical protein [Candidatus Nitrotoga sp. HW29]
MVTRRALAPSVRPAKPEATRPRPKVDAGRAPRAPEVFTPAFETCFRTFETKRCARWPHCDPSGRLGAPGLIRKRSSSREAMTQAPS